MHFPSFLVFCSVNSLFSHFPLNGHFILFLSFAWTNNITVYNPLNESFCIFVQDDFGLGSKKRRIESSDICICSITKYFHIPLGEPTEIVPFCILTIKVWASLFSHSLESRICCPQHRNSVMWWLRNGNSVKFSLTFLLVLLLFWMILNIFLM